MPGKQSKTGLMLEFDKKRVFNGFENPEAGDHQEKIAEHKDGEG